ncbi:MAG: Crp/Fnr family transcriptional regulator [Chakrabartia sp.]
MLYEAHQQRDAWVPQMPYTGHGDGLMGSAHNIRQHQHLMRGAERPDYLYQITSGWAGRYRLLSDGRRQITALYLPGDICDPCWLEGARAVQSVVALTPLQTIRAPRRELESQASVDVGLMKLLWRQTRFAQQIHGEWLVNLGRKNAIERLAHLLCELHCRLSLSGQVSDATCEMPLTQLDLADIAGLTPVHVNRTLQEMRAMRLIELQSRRLTILDWPAMRRIAWFDPHYLGIVASAEKLQAAA